MAPRVGKTQSFMRWAARSLPSISRPAPGVVLFAVTSALRYVFLGSPSWRKLVNTCAGESLLLIHTLARQFSLPGRCTSEGGPPVTMLWFCGPCELACTPSTVVVQCAMPEGVVFSWNSTLLWESPPCA